MDNIIIDYQVLSELIEKVDKIYDYVQRTERHSAEKEDEPWLDSYEVCTMLHISSKTLQRHRRDKLIPYSKMKGRCRYRASAINKAIKDKVITCEPRYAEEFRINYINDAK